MIDSYGGWINDALRSEYRHLPKEGLEVGCEYICDARNFSVGKWNGEKFEYMRTKWGSSFISTEYHYDDGAPYGTVKPYGKVGEWKGVGE